MIARFFITTSILVFTGCPRRASEPVDVTRFRDTLVYFGELSVNGLAALQRADDGAARTLMIRSNGGEVGIGMAFGEWVHSRQLDVVVLDRCLSSCANYVFPAGRRKSVLGGGLVAWHGNVHTASVDELPESKRDEVRAYLTKMLVRERAFYRRIGVSECLARIGNVRLGAPGFFTMSPTDMRRFGLDDVDGAPESANDVSPLMRSEFRFSFVEVPASLDAYRACE